MNALERGQRRRESSLPADNTTLEDALHEQLDQLNADVVGAFAEYCADKLETPLPLVAALIPDMVLSYRWESLRGVIGQRNPALAEYLGELVMSIDKLCMAFIVHEAKRRRKEAEEFGAEEAA
jgi:hypothetical protein